VTVSMKCPPEQSRHWACNTGKIVYHHLSTPLLKLFSSSFSIKNTSFCPYRAWRTW